MYIISSVVIITVFMILKKYEQKQNFWRSIIMSIAAYQCYLCMIAGLMTFFHIPVDTISVSVVNIISTIFMLIIIKKKKEIQRYYISVADSLFLLLLFSIVVCIFFRRFTTDLLIMFETSDPGPHLKMAMNFVNNKAVDFMYIGQLINGLMIETFMPIFSGELVYKTFIIQCGINFFMAGAVFWAVFQKSIKSKSMRLIVYATTLIYLLGYPYNDFLYGFVYLQMTVTMICYLIGLIQDFMDEQINIWIWSGLVGCGCLSVSIGYTLFAPPVYISILAVTVYKAHREKWFFSGKCLLNKRFIVCVMNIFLLPTFLTLWFTIIAPKINENLINYGSALGAEGAIYRNLYSDFLLFCVPALYGTVRKIQKREINLLPFLLPVFGIYYTVFLCLMLTNHVSTYYFYKLNYLLWMLILVSFAIGIEEFWQKDKCLFTLSTLGMAALAIIYVTKIEYRYQEKNIEYLPFADAGVFFRVNTWNRWLYDNKSQMSEGLVEVSGVVNDIEGNEPVVFIGYWQDLYWYEALTNQRFEGLHYYSYEDVMESFKRGEFGEYAVVKKESEGLEKYQQYILDNMIYESEYAYIIER